MKEHLLWTPLENHKIASFNLFYESFPNKPRENDELFSIYTSMASNNIMIIEGIGPIVNNFDWSAMNSFKHKKTASLINKSIKLSAGNQGNNIIEEEIAELTSSSSAKMNLIANKKKVVSLKKIKGKKIGKYDLPLQINHLPKPLKKTIVQNNTLHNTNSGKNSIRYSPNPSTKLNGNVPKHQGDDECDLFSDNEQ